MKLSPLRFVFTMLIFLGSLLMVSLCGISVVRFYFLKDDFVVVSNQIKCEPPLNNRCVTQYLVARPQGETYLVPFDSEFELDELGPGVKFKKHRNGFLYYINEVAKDWPAKGRKFIFMIVGFFGLALWFMIGGVRVLLVYKNELFKKIWPF